MKAVVLELHKGTAAVLCEDGTVRKVRRSCAVGDTIELDGGRTRAFPPIARYAAAAVLAVAVLGGAHTYFAASPYSYVSLDVNPSVEYTLNRMDRVISVRALNDDAVSVVDDLAETVRNDTLSEAVEKTLQSLYDGGYLDADAQEYAIASVASKSGETAEKLSAQLSGDVDAGESGLELHVFTAPLSDRSSADGQGISTGKYEVIKTIAAAQDAAGSGTVSSGEIQKYRDEPVDTLLRQAELIPETTQSSGESGSAGAAQAPAAPSKDRTRSGGSASSAEQGQTAPAAGQSGGAGSGGTDSGTSAPAASQPAAPAPAGSAEAAPDSGAAAASGGGETPASGQPGTEQTAPDPPADGTAAEKPAPQP